MPTPYVSPGAAASRAIMNFIAEREARKRQALLDEITMTRERRADEDRRAAQARQAEQDRVAAEDRQRRLAIETASLFAPGDTIDNDTAERFRRSGLGVLMSQGQPTQGAFLGEDENQIPQYNVVPGVVFSGTPAQRQEQEERDARQAYLDQLASDESQPPATRTWADAQRRGVTIPAGALPDDTDTNIEVREVGGFLYERQPDGRWLKVAEGRAPEARGITPTSEAAMINRLQTGWDKAQASTREMQRQYQIMRTGLDRFEQDPNGASQAVLVTFQKILDPTSVVRESEYARSSQGISMLGRIEGYAARLARGGAGVPKADLAAMVDTAAQFLNNLQNHTSGIRARTARTAARYSIPEDLIFADEGSVDESGDTVTVEAPTGERRAASREDAQRYVAAGARVVR